MNNQQINAAFAPLSTPLIADACVRLKLDLRLAPAGIKPVSPDMKVAGSALPVRHSGSVDVFLEAFENARPGQLLVIDDGGRNDQACIGDLTALEANASGVAALVVWGRHTITADDVVFADADGVMFVNMEDVEAVLDVAHEIYQTERQQAERILSGETLRDQLRFADYLAERAENPGFTLREHLRNIGGAIEE